ncbi:unnamed protein product [Pocillopora meandrina]|uniref:Importin-13 n=1 Tax=Pocillopora meandrina TaxID=46732 RepID=A0AAU9WHM0_9CNID|nr:unnamed protein product [Pocillopora meandrina]
MNNTEEQLQALLYQCEQALFTLYSGHDQTNRDTAHKWLLTTQKSHQAWQLCWRLMQTDKPPEIQFFGASMLYFKIAKNWGELQEEHYNDLRSELFKHIFTFSPGPRIVLTRLCVALGAFALNTMPEHWSNAISDIITTLQNARGSSQNGMWSMAMLEVLTVLPEEFHSGDFPPGRKLALRGELQNGVSQVLQVIQHNLLSSQPVQVRQQALKCMISWVQFGVTISDLADTLPLVFESIHNPELFDTSVDLIVEVATHPSGMRYPSYMWKFVSSVLTLGESLRTALQSGDVDTSRGLCRVMVSLAETHLKLLLSADSEEKELQGFTLVQLLLECTGAPGWYPVDEQCSEITFNFWYTLQDDISSEEPSAMEKHKAMYGPVLLSLCQVFMRKVQYPPENVWQGFSSDEKEQFRCYRQDIADTLMYVYCLLRGHCLQQLYHMLSELLAGETQPSWQSVDATLYLIQSVAEYVEPTEESFIPAILSLLPRLPSHSYVSQTALLMVGSYSEWLKCHPDHLRSVLPVLLGGLSQVHLASASTQALRGICEECVQDLEPGSLMEILTHCQTGLSGGVMKERERIRCVECIGHVLSVQDSASAVEQVKAVFTPYVEGLAQIVQQQPTAELKANLQFHLRLFVVLFKCLDPENENIGNKIHPAAVVLNDILPSLKSMAPWMQDNDVQQQFCLCLERAIGTIRDYMGGLVSGLSELVVGYFSVSPTSGILDIASTLIGMYGMVDEHYRTILLVFQRITTTTLQLLQSNLRDFPDILQSFMQFVCRGLKANPKLVFEGDGYHVNIFQCGLAALDVQESHTVRAACTFFSTFITACENEETAKRTLQEYGSYLVSQVIRGIAGGVPRQCTDYMAEILFALNRHNVTMLSRWMQEVMKVEGFPSNLVTVSQKEQFSSAVLRDRAHRRRVKESVTQFSLLCRGLYGTAYAS